uniref:Uncharacterized protein n=1 Tax=Oryza punctata TaxID=4537 RepID=A0A0E0JJN5_ORYPU
MKLVGSERRQRGGGFARAIKQQRARLYIIQRCVAPNQGREEAQAKNILAVIRSQHMQPEIKHRRPLEIAADEAWEPKKERRIQQVPEGTKIKALHHFAMRCYAAPKPKSDVDSWFTKQKAGTAQLVFVHRNSTTHRSA